MLSRVPLRLRVMLILASFLLVCIAPAITEAAAPLSSVACIITGTDISIGACIASSAPFWAIGIMLSFALVGFSYMLGEIFQLGSLRGWYRNELWESVKTILMISAIFSLLVIFSSMASSLAGTGSAPASAGFSGQVSQNLGGLYYVANSYLSSSSGYAQNSLITLFGTASGVDFIKSLRYSIWFPYPPVPTLPPEGTINAHFGSSGPLFLSNIIDSDYSGGSSSMLGTATTFIVLPSLILLQIMSDLFTNIVALGFGLLIPIGLVFRAIPFLRGFGGTFIAIGIGVSLVFPMLFVVINIPISDFVLGQQVYCGGNVQTQCTFLGYSTSSSTPTLWTGVTSVLSGAVSALAKFLVSSIPTVGASQQFNTGYYAGIDTFLSTSIYPAADLITSVILNSMLQFMLLIIDFIVGYTITKTIATNLGGTIRIGFGKMKLA